jgi:adenosylcobinamide-GDP ribazoletransferase
VVLTALSGAVGFLTRLPVGRSEAAWDAFRGTPAAFPLAGWLVGALLTLPLALGYDLLGETPTTAFAFVVWVYLVTGINHVDGVADLGDAMVVHGGPAERREVLKDTTVGVGAVLAVGIVLLGLFSAATTLARLQPVALAVVVAAEVGAKAGMAVLVCTEESFVEGLGSTFTDAADRGSLPAVAVVTLPVAVLGWPSLAPGVALAGALATTLAVRAWAHRRLGGVNGDVFGASNELARVVALHAGVIAWTLS